MESINWIGVIAIAVLCGGAIYEAIAGFTGIIRG